MSLVTFRKAMSAAAVLLLAWPAAAQFNPGPDGDYGMQVRSRPLKGNLGQEVGNGTDAGSAGRVGSGIALSQVAVRYSREPIEYSVATDGLGWGPWKKAGELVGVVGKPLEGIRFRVGKGTIRYRGSFVGTPLSDWVSDEAPLGGAGQKLALESFEVEFRRASRAGATFQYRVLFRGSGFTEWLEAGTPATSVDKSPEVLAYQIRNGGGIRYDASLSNKGWTATASEGETAGDPSGARRVEAIRVFGGKNPVTYRVRMEHAGWTPWATDGVDCGLVGRSLRMEAIEIKPDFAGTDLDGVAKALRVGEEPAKPKTEPKAEPEKKK